MYNTKHLSKGQKRKILRNLKEIADAYTTHEVHVTKAVKKPQCPRPITIKPSARKPGPWRILEIFTLDSYGENGCRKLKQLRCI